MFNLPKRSSVLVALSLTTALYSTACRADESVWPKIKKSIPIDADIEARIDSLIAQMSIEQKVGQMIQPEIKHISPDLSLIHI